VVVDETVAFSAEFGTLMICPAHAYGTPQDAEKFLKEKLSGFNGETSSIVICRAMQDETLKQFAPLVDRVVLNPFVSAGKREADAAESVWPGLDHPVLNKLRELRRIGGDKSLIAILNVDGEKWLHGNRAPSFEEVEWEACAVAGARFQGIAWRPQRGDLYEGRLNLLHAALQRHGTALAKARPVPWVACQDRNQPVTALYAPGRLFIVLLNPQYMSFEATGSGANGPVQVALDPQPRAVELHISLPPGAQLRRASTLSSRTVRPHAESGSVSVRARLTGGGEIIVCDIDGGPAGAPEGGRVGASPAARDDTASPIVPQ
jgi:hypothetical protein